MESATISTPPGTGLSGILLSVRTQYSWRSRIWRNNQTWSFVKSAILRWLSLTTFVLRTERKESSDANTMSGMFHWIGGSVVVDFLFIVIPIVGVWSCSVFCCTLLYINSSFVIILMGKRELVDLLGLSSWSLEIVVWLFLAVPWACL